MRRWIPVLLGGLFLFGCTAAPPPPPAATGLAPDHSLSRLRDYPDTGKFLQCVPFARAVSGIDLYGDAWTWWDAAARRFERGRRPEEGAVLVLRRTPQLPAGHVAVVARLQDSRHMLLTHANWGMDGDTRGVIHERQPIMDVSKSNDWSEIRLMNRHGQYGRVYPAYGFIYPPQHFAVNR